MKLFSIITICRNNLKELKRTYFSIRDQSFSNFEWIVVDGASTDGTAEWLKKNALARFRSEPDNGIFDAMNKGLSRAKGDYIIFMNSGDRFAHNDVLEKIARVIEEHSLPGFIYGDSLDIDQNRKPHYRKAKNATLIWRGMITQHQAMFFKSNAIGDTRYRQEYPTTADYAFVAEILQKLDPEDIVKVDFPVCKFEMGGVNEQQRFKALKEDRQIRINIMKMPVWKAEMLYALHWVHTRMKKQFPESRFLMHKEVESAKHG
ncbi:MAG: colanic acid biosynthesis glycosyltransferase WcaE [Bacteroidales bacterium]